MEKNMECNMKHILIIAYRFPPMGGIGTRRWAKFAKYLAKEGYKVHVITIDNTKVGTVNWFHDIKENQNILIHRIKAAYPIWLLNTSSNRYIAFIKRLLNFILRKTLFDIDIAQNWAKYMLPAAKKIITEHNIHNIIVTSAPHSVSYISTYLKIDLPHINLIQDFRDSWNDDYHYDYPKRLSFFYQKEKSAYMEWFVITHSDFIVNVSQDITNKLKNKYKHFEQKLLTIHNGFDRDDIKNIALAEQKSNDNISILYAGELGFGRINAIKLMMDVLLSSKDLSDKITIHIYSSFNKKELEHKYAPLLDKVVFFHSLIPSSKIFDKISENNYCLSINAPIYPYAFGTKVFDYMMLNKKIIHISGDGELSKLMISFNQFSVDYDLEKIKDMLYRLVPQSNSNTFLAYEKFNIENLTKAFERLFID